MTIEKFKLYHYPATRSARVKWMLHEVLEDDFEVKVVDLYQGVQYQDDFVAKNPNHNVPVLEMIDADGNCQTMLESGAMVALLADMFPQKQLAPLADEQPLARADYLHMMYFGASWMDMILWQLRMHKHLLPEADRDSKTFDRYTDKFTNEIEPQLKARLEKAPYICGEKFTAADCIIAHNVMWARGYGLCQDGIFGQYLSVVSKRPGFMRGFADAKQFQLEVPEGSDLNKLVTG
ncbi:MAG: glutathione S-transferase family protein [Algicola sp.]|nr:glutathione S-transferase family protein [Algicola sp.]